MRLASASRAAQRSSRLLEAAVTAAVIGPAMDNSARPIGRAADGRLSPACCGGLLVDYAGRIGYPYDLEWMEGGMLAMETRGRGESLYVLLSADFIPLSTRRSTLG